MQHEQAQYKYLGDVIELDYPTSLGNLTEKFQQICKFAETNKIFFIGKYFANTPQGIKERCLRISDEASFKSFDKLVKSGSVGAVFFFPFCNMRVYCASNKRYHGIDVLEGYPEISLHLGMDEPALLESFTNELKDVVVCLQKQEKDRRNRNHGDSKRKRYQEITSATLTLEALCRYIPPKSSIMLRLNCIAYSTIALEDLLVPVPKFACSLLDMNPSRSIAFIQKDFVQSILDGKRNSPILLKKVKDHNIPDLAKKVAMIKDYLDYHRNMFHPNSCYSEANRRIALNCILLPAIAPPTPAPCTSSSAAESTAATEEIVSVDAEHLMEELDWYPRVGSGPLDYFIRAPSSSMIAMSIHSATSQEEENVAEAEALYFPTSGVHTVANILGTVIEANADCDLKDLLSCLGQLFAQMLDALNLPESAVSRKRKRTTKRFVKGVLSTGQQSFFFSMSQESSSSVPPELLFYGKYSLNFLPRQSGRISGLKDINQPIDENEIKRLVQAYNFFARYNGDIDSERETEQTGQE